VKRLAVRELVDRKRNRQRQMRLDVFEVMEIPQGSRVAAAAADCRRRRRRQRASESILTAAVKSC
jgi:hypothetical protein